MKRELKVAHMIHVAELAWILAWLLLGAVVLIGLNTAFVSSQGERSLWQLIFGFLS